MIERYWVWVSWCHPPIRAFPIPHFEKVSYSFDWSISFVKLSSTLWRNLTVLHCAQTGRRYWRIWRRKESLHDFTREVLSAKKTRTRSIPNLLLMSKENVCSTCFPKEDQKLSVPFATSYMNYLPTWNHFWGRVRYFMCCNGQPSYSIDSISSIDRARERILLTCSFEHCIVSVHKSNQDYS